MLHKGRSCTSGEQWEIIQPLLLPSRQGPGRPPELDLRRVADAIFYVVRTGCQWKNLPGDYPNSNSIYYYYAKWRGDGAWQWVSEALRHQERQRRGRKPEPGAIIADGRSVKTTETGGVRGCDADKKVSGIKRHIAVDTQGLPHAIHATTSGVTDRAGALAMFG